MIPVKQQAQVCLRPDGHVCVFRRRRFTVSNGNKKGDLQPDSQVCCQAFYIPLYAERLPVTGFLYGKKLDIDRVFW